MPQMAPLMWLNLMLMFLLGLLVFFSVTYFNNLSIQPKSYVLSKHVSQKTWKW